MRVYLNNRKRRKGNDRLTAYSESCTSLLVDLWLKGASFDRGHRNKELPTFSTRLCVPFQFTAVYLDFVTSITWRRSFIGCIISIKYHLNKSV